MIKPGRLKGNLIDKIVLSSGPDSETYHNKNLCIPN
jgi:hypothetical protein